MSPFLLVTAFSRATKVELLLLPLVALLTSITPSPLWVTVWRTAFSTTSCGTLGTPGGVKMVTYAYRRAVVPVSAVSTSTFTTLLSAFDVAKMSLA